MICASPTDNILQRQRRYYLHSNGKTRIKQRSTNNANRDELINKGKKTFARRREEAVRIKKKTGVGLISTN